MYIDIRGSIYRLPQVGALAKKVPKENLARHGYFEVTQNPGSWQHITRPIYFSLVVDDFGVKYIDKADSDHLIVALKKQYEISKDWTGGLYCGIKLKWTSDRDIQKGYIDIFMPSYITKKIEK